MRLLLILLCASITCGIVVEYDFEARQTVCKPDGFPRSCLGFFLKDSPSGTAPFPGPLVKARVGDTLRVHVRNFLHEEIVSVHWHGLHMRFNAWQDGTPFITDCGIRPGATRVYEFLVEQAGTYFYHSHTCAQYTDGLLGPIVIESDDDKVKFGYKEEHVLMLQDWQHESRKDLMAAMSPFGAFAGFKPFYPFPPVSLLLNGHGKFDCSRLRNFEECDEARAAGCQCVPLRTSFFGACSLPSVPEPVFSCTGSRMRLRLINGSGNMPLRFQIEETQMLLIAQDGCDLDLSGNRLVDTLLLPVGQRVDVLVQCKPANSRPLKMLVTVAQAFVPPQACVLNISTWGVMVSSGSHDNNVATATSVESMVFNDLDVDQQLKIFNRPPVELKVAPAAKERIVLVSIGAWDEGELGSELEYWLINGKSWTMPREPLLQYWKRNGQTMPLNDDVFGPIVVPLQLGSVYEVVMINLSMQQHPWHLHGYHVDIVDVGFIRGGDYAEDFNYSAVEKFPRDVAAPVMTRADSWLVPQYGFVVFRFTADNPGPWMLHCHVEWHMMMGMAMVFSVEPFTSLLPPPPHLTVCGETYNSLEQLHGSLFGWALGASVCVCCVVLVVVCGILLWKWLRSFSRRNVVEDSIELATILSSSEKSVDEEASISRAS